MKYFLPGLAAMALAGPALAQAASQSAAEPAVEEADNSQNRMICKKEKQSGTRLGSKRTCMTAAQWAQVQRDQREATERAQANRPRDN
jgi:uncharacterized protein (DUF2147 family)